MPTVSEAIQAIPDLVRRDSDLLHRLRDFNGRLSVAAGSECWFLPFDHGQPGDAIPAGMLPQPATVSFLAAPEVWQSHWQSEPSAPDQDLFCMANSNKMRINGDMTIYMQQLQNIKDVLAKPRVLFS